MCKSPNNLAVANGIVIHPKAYLVLRLDIELRHPCMEFTEGKSSVKF